MSRRYAVDGVLILKLIVLPTFTLVSVEKPSIVELGFGVSQVDWGVPAFVFSHATGLPPVPHGSTVAAPEGAAVTPVTSRTAHNAMVVRSAAVRRDSLDVMIEGLRSPRRQVPTALHCRSRKVFPPCEERLK